MPFPRVLRRRGFWFGVVCVCLLTYFYIYFVPIKKTTDEFSHTRLPRFIWLSLDNTSALSQCRNSIQGPKLITDELGYVCPLSWVLPTGCCNIDHAVRFDCRSCLQTTDCCAIYEHCVSCCLRPDKKPILEAILTHSANSLHPLYTSVKDQFELCLSKCRTSSQSVYHENSYRKPDTKYCYGQEFGITTIASTTHNHRSTRSKTEKTES